MPGTLTEVLYALYLFASALPLVNAGRVPGAGGRSEDSRVSHRGEPRSALQEQAMRQAAPRRGVVVRQIHAPVAGAKALRDQRIAQLTALTQAAEEPPCVDIYVLGVPGRDPGPRTAYAAKAAEDRGWTIGQTFVDTTGPTTDLALCPALSLALDRIAQGESSGLVAMSQTDFSSFTDERQGSIRQITQETGRAYGTIYRFLTDAEIPLRGRGGAHTRGWAQA
ncbi:helix-turn-helix domain-containing protein [Streptomyces sp. NPDC048269]|uniref:helix-turn-helix domain-containing protein n=1 Tax=Streptomyces sp. NPDC048269 TaxID=3155753 RepID=UPI0034482B07